MVQGKEGKATRLRRTLVRRREGRPQSRRRTAPKSPAKSAHDRTRTCTPFPTLVPQTSLSTNSSTWALCRTEPSRAKCSGRDSNPHGVNPHRVLNPARLPIPPPELDPYSGAEGNRTPDLSIANAALSQLSYGPEWAREDSNLWPLRCQRSALTN